jgi:predicted amidohydrolase
MSCIALANLAFPADGQDAVHKVCAAIAEAARSGAEILCFPECYLPGYRSPGRKIAPPDAAFLEFAWRAIAVEAAAHRIVVILGTERYDAGRLLASALVIDQHGTMLGFQDKVQIAREEEGVYTAGEGRHVFTVNDCCFGIVICHEGWRYPETARAAVLQGAQIVFHPHFHEWESGAYVPRTFGDPANSFFEKAMLCRAAENDCWLASVNYASENSPTTSAIIRPDGSVLAYQPYGVEGLLIAQVDLPAAKRIYATRLKPAVPRS